MTTLPPLTIFDVETTGLDPRKGHRIIELAGMRIERGSFKEEMAFCSYVNPERGIPWEVKQIHHIGDEAVRGAPTIMTVLPQFLEFARGSILIAHNAAFDKSFLECEKEFCWGYIELPEMLCTMRLSQNLYPTAFRHSLDALCERFKIPLPADRHRALADVTLTGTALLRMLEDGKIRSMDELRRKASLDTPLPVASAKPPMSFGLPAWKP